MLPLFSEAELQQKLQTDPLQLWAYAHAKNGIRYIMLSFFTEANLITSKKDIRRDITRLINLFRPGENLLENAENNGPLTKLSSSQSSWAIRFDWLLFIMTAAPVDKLNTLPRIRWLDHWYDKASLPTRYVFLQLCTPSL